MDKSNHQKRSGLKLVSDEEKLTHQDLDKPDDDIRTNESDIQYQWISKHADSKILPLGISSLTVVLIVSNIIIQGLSYWRGHFSKTQAIQFLIISILIIIAYIRVGGNGTTTYSVDSKGIEIGKKVYAWSDMSWIKINPDTKGWSIELIPRNRFKLMPTVHVSNQNDLQNLLSISNNHVDIKS